MRVASVLLLTALTCAATATSDTTHGQLRQRELPPAPSPVPVLIEGLASIGNAFQLAKQQQDSTMAPEPRPTPATTSQAQVPEPTVVANSLSCRSSAKKLVKSDVVLAQLVAITDTLETIKALLETRG